MERIPCRITFGIVTVTDEEREMRSVRITNGCCSDGFASYGCTVSPTCTVEMECHDAVVPGMTFVVEFFMNGEWVHFGKYKIMEPPVKDDGWVTFNGYGMLSTVFESTVLDLKWGNVEYYKNQIREIAQLIKMQTGVELVFDGASSEQLSQAVLIPTRDVRDEEGQAWIEKPIPITARQMVGAIAFILGGNAVEEGGRIHIRPLGYRNKIYYEYLGEDDYYMDGFHFSDEMYTPARVYLEHQQMTPRLGYIIDGVRHDGVAWACGDSVTSGNLQRTGVPGCIEYSVTVKCDFLDPSIADGYSGDWSFYSISFAYQPCSVRFVGYDERFVAGNLFMVDYEGEPRQVFVGTVEYEWDGGFTTTVSSEYTGDTEGGNCTAIGSTAATMGNGASYVGLVNEYAQFNKAYAANLEADRATVKNLEATVATIETANIKRLEAADAEIENLRAKTVEIETATVARLSAVMANVGSLEASVANIETANAERLNVLEARIESITATDITTDYLEANYASIQSLSAIEGDIQSLLALEAKVNNLAATTVTTGYLETNYASLNYVQANFANLQALNAIEGNIITLTGEFLSFKNGDFQSLKANYADISTLLFGNASGNVLTTQFANSVASLIGNATIKDAMIDNLSVSKILAGDISTNKFRIVSDSGNMLLSDNTILIKDGTRARVQIGKDGSNDYNMYVWDKSGNLMFDALGLTAGGIQRQIIRNDMVSDKANIDAKKLDIQSLFTEMNGSTQTLKASKIQLDTTAQTLNVAFESLSTTLSGLSTTVASQGTAINAIQGQISSKVWQQDINTATSAMSTQYSSLLQTVNGISSEVASVNTKYDELAIGGRNLLLNSATFNFMTTFLSDFIGKQEVISDNTVPSKKIIRITCTKAGTGFYSRVAQWGSEAGSEPGKTYTYSFWARMSRNITLAGSTNPRIGYERGGLLPAGTVIGTEWKYFTHTFTANDYANSALIWYLKFEAGDVLEIHSFKIEEGNKATYWTPAPEDVQAQIDATTTSYSQLADRFSWVVTGGTSASNMTLSSNLYKLIAENIDLTGKVTFNSLDSSTQTKVNTAASNASSALTTANTASTTADNAQTTANTAKTTADTAKTNAATALSTANTANSSAANTAATLANWTYTGTTEINGAKIRTGTITADKITVASLEAIVAKIGGFTINSTAIYKGTSSKTSTTAGIYLGTDAIRAYSSSTAYTHIESGKLTCVGATINGTLTATAGTIGGFTINSTSIYKNTSSLSSTTEGIYLGTDGISCGGKFTVSTTGTMDLYNSSRVGDGTYTYTPSIRGYGGTMFFYAKEYGTGDDRCGITTITNSLITMWHRGSEIFYLSSASKSMTFYGTATVTGNFACSGTASFSGAVYIEGGRATRSLDNQIVNLQYGGSTYMHVGTNNYGAFGINWWASDKALKDNITASCVKAIEVINKLNLVQFDWKSGEGHVPCGLIADDLEKVIPEAVFRPGQYRQIDVNKLMPYALKSIQEVSYNQQCDRGQIAIMQAQIGFLTSQNKQMENQIEALTKQLASAS